MGIGHSYWGNSKRQRPPKAESNDRKRRRETSSFIEFMMPTCLWRNGEAKKMQTNPEKKQQHQLVKETDKETTLMEWLLSSPASDHHSHGDEYNNVVKQFSKKVYPSLGDNMDYGSNNRGSLSKERLLKLNEANKSREREDVSSVSRDQSGNSKKRVSFRLQEEVGIFVYSPPEEEDMLECRERCKLPLLS